AVARAARALHAPMSSSERARENARREREEGRVGAARDVARAIGVALHCALEHWPIGRPAADQVARAALERALAPRVPAPALEAATREAGALFDAFAASELARRLDALEGRFHARELALVLRAEGDEGPTGAWVGAADLVFEEDGGLVVVDFKTDRGDDDALCAAYAPQLALYAQALVAALGRPVLRAELWRLGEGRALEVPLDFAAPPR
ncbi:MAG TPA: PD-(D/E)XK nuclease family protein, partial [Planctomycetota bacterium]|nr:PD-(D/E)XK nuclease family protein [Planctomycetota bacterium]